MEEGVTCLGEMKGRREGERADRDGERFYVQRRPMRETQGRREGERPGRRDAGIRCVSVSHE